MEQPAVGSQEKEAMCGRDDCRLSLVSELGCENSKRGKRKKLGEASLVMRSLRKEISTGQPPSGIIWPVHLNG